MPFKKRLCSALLLFSLVLGLPSASAAAVPAVSTEASALRPAAAFALSEVPKYSGKPYVKIHNNKPYFKKAEYTTKSFEKYRKLDKYSRCRVATACVGKDLMPTEPRGSIGMIKPSGWHTVKYDCVDGKYLYNRCHLIGWQLTAENANERNLITGTRYLNVIGMLPFENQIADYVKRTDNHVLYRVTPIFKKKELVARGVLMEAYSVEDKGRGVKFCVYCYNVQPQIKITYSNGNSRLIGGGAGQESDDSRSNAKSTYILNTNTKVFHRPTCASVKRMAARNKQSYTGSRKVLIGKGYAACKVCKP